MCRSPMLILLFTLVAKALAARRCTSDVTHYMMQRLRTVPDDFHNARAGQPGNQWMQENWEPSMRCLNDRRLGPPGDGGKWVCDPVCLLRNNVVFSVGSNNDFSFEKALQPYNATVHTFDHTVQEAKDVPDGVMFHYVGLGPSILPGNHDRGITTLRDMAARAGVSRIAVLKVDCEGCEFDAFTDPDTLDFLKQNVEQLLVEVHWRSAAETEKLAQALTDAGFRIFSKEPNIAWSNGNCVEFSLFNSNVSR